MSTQTAQQSSRSGGPALWAAAGALLTAGAMTDVQNFTMLAPSLGAIIADLHLTPAQVGWTLNASTIASAMSVALTSKMGDVWGHRKVLATLSALSMLGCVIAALAPNFALLVIGRFLIGLVVGVPLGWGLVRPRARAGQISLIAVWLSTIAAVFTPLAVVAGGLFLKVGLPWQTSLWLVFAVAAVLLVFTLLTPETPAGDNRALSLDWWGSLGVGVWAILLLLALDAASSAGWLSPRFLTLAGAGVVVLAFWIVQQRHAKNPMMSLAAMDVRQAVMGCVAIASVGVVGALIYVATPTILQVPTSSGWGLGLDPFRSTLPLLAIVPGSIVAAFVVRTVVPRVGPKAVLVSSYIASLGCFVGVALGHGNYALFFLWCFLYGVTIMTVWGVGYQLVASSTRQDNAATTFGVVNVLLFLMAAFTVATLLNATAPGAGGVPPESGYVGVFLGVSVLMLVLAGLQAVFAPRQVSDLHAV